MADDDPERFETLPDMVPKRQLYEEPVRVESIEALPPEPVDERRFRVTFWVNVRDAVGEAVRELAVEARIIGPERTGHGVANTDEHGQVRFRMTGPTGHYRCEITDIGAGAIEVARTGSAPVASLDAEI